MHRFPGDSAYSMHPLSKSIVAARHFSVITPPPPSALLFVRKKVLVVMFRHLCMSAECHVVCSAATDTWCMVVNCQEHRDGWR